MNLTLLLVACATNHPAATPSATDGVATAVDLDDPATCAPCHATVVAEWEESMHARSHASKDPLVAGMQEVHRAMRGSDAFLEGCEGCHAPRVAVVGGAAHPESGVTCASCHLVADVHPERSGTAAFTYTERQMHGPHDIAEGASPVHGTGPAATHLTDGRSLCLACHGEHENAQGVATCSTGIEHRATHMGKTCTDCHMPRVAGPSGSVSTRADHANHRFLGPHRAWLQDDPSFLAEAVSIDMKREGNTLELWLTNQTGHAFPTGFPGRTAVLSVVGKDAAGTVVWRNWKDDPMKEDRASVLNKVYVDADGAPTMPPKAMAIAQDTRLLTDEVRRFAWEVPSSTASVEATIVLRLVPATMAAHLGLQGARESEPRVVARASL